MNSLPNEELDDPELIIIPMEPETTSDEEELDYSIMNCIIAESWGS